MAGESPAAMAANQQALRQAAQNWGIAFSAAAQGSSVGAEQAGELIVDIVQDLLGELYPPASEPGEAPHLRTGDLQESYESWINDNVLSIGSDAEYAPYLEFGTSIMQARPHLRPAIEQSLADGRLGRIIVYSIAQAQTAALAGRRFTSSPVANASQSVASGLRRLLSA